MTVNAEGRSQLTDGRIRMLHKVVEGLEVWFCRVLYGLLQNGIIQWTAERQSVARQVIVHILSHVQVHRTTIVSLQTLEDNLLTMADYTLYDETLYLRHLFLLGVQSEVIDLLAVGYWLLAIGSIFAFLYPALFFLVASNIFVGLRNQCTLIDIQATRALGDIGCTYDGVRNHAH